MDQTTERMPSASASVHAAMAGPQLSLESIFPGTGEMAERMRAMDWSQTPLGRVEDWPQSLRTAVSICLASRFPIWLGWGPDLVMLYNDAYRPILGAKHPASLGAPARQVWSEIWHIIGPMLEGVLREGKATWSEDQFLPLERSGYAEECYFTFSYSPIHDESGSVGGMFCAVAETTSRVLAVRHTRTARDVAAAIVDAHTAEAVCQRAIEVVGHNPADVPFTLLYLLDRDGTHAHLAATAGLVDHHALAPTTLTLPPGDEETSPAGELMHGVLGPWVRAAQTGRREVVPLAAEIWDESLAPDRREWKPKTAVALPIIEPGQSQPSALLVAGVSPMRALDDDYEGFYELLVSHLASGLAAAHAYEEERKRAEALAELDRAKTAFFSNVSHEFRTPLTLMLGPLEDSLSDTDEPLPPHQRERQLLVQRNSLRLLKLVNTLLDFARIEAGRAQATYVPTDLATFTVELASSFRSLIEKAGMELVVDCPPLDGCVREPVYVDREMWEKIVLNLVSNAFKFTFAGIITVALHPIDDGRQVALTVSDTGVGIPTDELPRVFERFHRVHGVRSRSYEGSGIGLALVHELVHLHGGAITVASQVGHGTTFTVTLPTGTAHLSATRIHDTATGQGQRDQHTAASTALGAVAFVEEARRWLPDGPDGHASGDAQRDDEVRWLREDGKSPVRLATPSDGVARARILLADDNADLREYLQRLLSDFYEVEVVPNGAAALAAARVRMPDLILSDVMMPELDGFGLLRALRDDPRTRAIPVILLSARAGEEATIEGLEAGADDYLVKPFSTREVLARIASHLEITRLRREAMARARELETAFEAIADAVFIYDHAGRILRTNAAARALFALDALPEYEIGSPAERSAITQTRDEQDNPIHFDESGLARLLRGEALTGSNTLDVRLRSVDGRDLQVNISGAPLRDETGAIVGAIAVSRDVTERRRLERRTYEALNALLAMARELVSTDVPSGTRELAIRLAALARHVLDCEIVSLVGVDETGSFVPLATVGRPSVDEATRYATVGRLRSETYYSADQLDRLRAGQVIVIDIAAARDQGLPTYGTQAAVIAPLTADGMLTGILSAAYTSAVHEFSAGELELVSGFAQMAHLVLQRERLLSEREGARAEALALTEATRRMDEFLGIASHELRTPLTSITANVHLAGRQLQSLLRASDMASQDRLDSLLKGVDRSALLLERTKRQVVRMDRLVGDLLDASRIEADKLELRLEPCDLLTVIREAVLEQRAAWPSRSILLDLPRRAEVTIHADADRIGQVVTNFLTNALKYSPPDQPVAVRMRVQVGCARIEVRDRGPGLSPEQQQHLFQRFYRVPGIEQQSGSGVGLGLGLHICKTIIERHSGDVGVESTPGEGSTFWFTLPLAMSPAS